MQRRVVFVCVALVVSLMLNVWLFYRMGTGTTSLENNSFSAAQKHYPYLSKRILQEFPQDVLINFLPLRGQIHQVIKEYDDSFALYFEYLPTGSSISEHANREFIAASLFKLPVIMGYYHQRERLNQTDDPILTIAQDDLDRQFGTLWKKGEGTKIRASEAVRLAIEESDNTAAKLIARHVEQEDFDAVYNGLDLTIKTTDEGAVVTAKSYASILKALYFSSALNKDNSQHILSLLTKTSFTDKLPAGVASDIPVAHKIGVVEDKGYMDCGIVYVTKRPYLLCMVSGSDEATSRSRMVELSKLIYNYVVSLP